MESTPVSLLHRLQQPGDPAAWERFVELYTPLLYSWARRFGLQAQDAADLVQDVFILLLRKMKDFHYDARRSFRGWLRTVALNQWRDSCRRRAADRQAADDRGLAEHGVPDPQVDQWEAEYRQYLVHRALQVMKSEFQPRTWQACWEMVVADRPAVEVAAQLGLSPDAVYAAKYRVLRRMRLELDGLFD